MNKGFNDNKNEINNDVEGKNSKYVKNRSMIVWALFFAAITAFMGIGLVDPILPAISSQLGASQTEATLLFSGYNGVMALAMLITGFISNRLGNKKTLLLGIAIIAAFSIMCGLATNVWTIIGLRCGWGLGNAIFIAVALTTIILYSADKIKKSIIMYEAAIGLGLSAGPLIGGFLGEISWKLPFFGVGLLMFLAFILVTILMPKSPDSNDMDSNKNSNENIDENIDDDIDEGINEDIDEDINESSDENIGEGIDDVEKVKGEENNNDGIANTSILAPFRAMRHNHILIFGLFAFLYNFGFFTLLAYAPFVLGLSAQGIGVVFLAWGVFVAINSVIVAPRLRKRIGSIKSLYIIILLFAVLLLVMGLFTSIQWVVISTTVISGILVGNLNTLLTTAVMENSPIDNPTTSSAYNFLRFIGSAIAPALAGFLGEFVSPSTPFLVGCVFCTLAVTFLFLNRRNIQHVDENFLHVVAK